MKILLDTHIFLWYITKNKSLPSTLIPVIRDPENDVYLSSVSVWEVIVKYQLGKLPLPQAPATFIPEQRRYHQISSLPLDEASVSNLENLSARHKDPFDRMLICQAIQHQLSLVTTDQALQAYVEHVSLLPKKADD
jgi:PIN domain nuclease of toxin-antitoxin system